VATYRLNHISKANQWGFIGGCTSYEGGPSLPAGGSTTNLGNQILANRTEKMQDVVKLNYLEGWKNIGGGLAMYFTLNSAYNRYGCWGITDDYTKPDRNFKMKAIREIIAKTASSVDESEEDNLIVYPNPAEEFIEIAHFNRRVNPTVDLQYHIRVFNLLGEIVYTGPTLTESDDGFRIDLTALQPGVYLLKINNKIRIIIKI
jgi:hypothetical protein